MPTRRVGLTSCCVVLRPHGCCGRRVRCSADRAAWCAGGRRSFCFCLWPRQISGRRAAASNRSGCLCVVRPGPAGLAVPSTSVRLVAVCCPAGPAAAPGHRSLAPSIAQDSHPVVTSHIPEPTANFACNSPESILRFELWALELQRFHTLLKLHPIELHASFLRGGRIGACWWRSWIPQARCAVVWKRRRLCLLVPVWG